MEFKLEFIVIYLGNLCLLLLLILLSECLLQNYKPQKITEDKEVLIESDDNES